MSPKGSDIRLRLNRPEYVNVPEAFLTALAWKEYDAPTLVGRSGKKPVGLYFRGDAPKGSNVEFRRTSPTDLGELAAALSDAGIVSEGRPEDLAEALLNSVLGIQVGRSDVQPTSPISPSLALLQNTRGLLGKQNPPDIAAILETMFQMGFRDATDDSGVAARWRLAASRRMQIDPLISSFDSALDDVIVHRHERTSDLSSPPSRPPGLFPDTPFEWFATAWGRLTSQSWVEALPARVWVDWATTVLRIAFGAGFLWESSWNIAIAREITRTAPVTGWFELQSTVGETIPWVSSRAGTAARDVAPKLLRRVHQGEVVRHALTEWMANADVDEEGFEVAIATMRADTAFRKEMLEALGSNRRVNSGTNLWEAIRYALMTRAASSDNPDYYGLLHASGRFLTVSPGTEWIAVIASLACGDPGGVTDVKRVLVDLAMLGLRPELADLVALLERAGMARGSADADSGVLVESAF